MLLGMSTMDMSSVDTSDERVWRVRAHNTAADSENQIHDDRVAAAYGFRGGLVPGVTVYGYMTSAMIHGLGRAWLERGACTVRFLAPFYEGDIVVTRYTVGDVLTVSAEREDGTVCATATATVIAGAEPFPQYSNHPLPTHEERPVASVESLKCGSMLGSITTTLDIAESEAAPERFLHMANEILVRNFRLNPWIHVGSEVRHHNAADPGESVVARGVILDAFEKKGRHFAVAGLTMSGRDGRPLAAVRHTFIYGLLPA
jgi:acyl dehydratase